MPRGRSTREVPPPLELQCLAALWELQEGNVQQVRDWLSPRRTLAYTTVMTMLDRLARKNLVSRRKLGRSYLYVPAITREEVRLRAVREVVDSLFDGSQEALARFLSSGVQAAAPVAAFESNQSLDTTLL